MAALFLLLIFPAVYSGAGDAQETAGGESHSALATSLPDLSPGPDGKLSADQMHRLFQLVAEKDIQNQKQARDYTYIAREVENKLDGRGQTKSTEVKTYEVLEIYGEQVQRLIEKDDKPLEGKDAAKEEEKIQKIIDKRKHESEKERQKREEKEEKEREDGRKFVREVADAYDFTLLGSEPVGGREAWVFQGEPRPGFEPRMKESRFLIKFHGRVWIDKTDLQMARLDVEAVDTVSLGWVLARVHKGTRFMIEQTRVNDEVWLPRLLTFKVDARLALLKGFKLDGEETFRDYRKFRTSSKIVGMGEVQ
ncbi:MAG TPA: hypothetical protein VFA67_12305 [Candidatus Sulfotelmatobacter sp.]|nr:hypothetical protein [Candidatus Sulfotelmatobacter sp.]